MPTYKMLDGDAIEAASPTELVTLMRDGSKFAGHQTLAEYMAGYAGRYREYYEDVDLRHETAEEFVQHLAAIGFVTITI